MEPVQIYKPLLSKLPWAKKNINLTSWIKKVGHQNEQKDHAPPAEKVKTVTSPIKQGLDQYTKDQTLRQATDKHKIDELVRRSNRSIITISSVFPWTLFPNMIDVEEERITFIFRQFMSYQTHSVDIKDISNVFIESGFFFATLQVVSRTYVQNDIKINYLRKNQAIKVKSVIEGLRTFNRNNIDTSHYNVDELVEKLGELHVAR